MADSRNSPSLSRILAAAWADESPEEIRTAERLDCHEVDLAVALLHDAGLRTPVDFATGYPDTPYSGYPYDAHYALGAQAERILNDLREHRRSGPPETVQDQLQEFVGAVERVAHCRELQAAAYDSGFYLSADGSTWGVVRGRELRPFHGVWDDLLVPPMAGN